MEHIGDENTEELRIVKEKIDVNVGEFVEDFWGGVPVVEQIFYLAVELLDVVEEDLGVNFLLAVVVKIDGTLAEFRFLGDAFDSDGLESFFKKELPRSLENGCFATFLFPFSSLLKPQDEAPLP